MIRFASSIFIISVFSISAWATGWDSGNAGDPIAAEFKLTGRDIVQRLELLSSPKIDTTNLRLALDALVTSAPHVFVDNVERAAKNHYPDSRWIEVGQVRWQDLRKPTNTVERLRVVLHEYLWTSGVADEDYVRSDYLLQLINIGNYSPGVWWNPVNPTNTVVPTLEYAPAGCAFASVDLNVQSSSETLIAKPTGDCGDAYRELKIVKTAGVTPPSTNVRGTFHKFELTVYDRAGALQGEVGFEPAWGECLLPDSGACRVSGTLTIGGVDIQFWFLRK
jgi:hypothetical protein